MFEKQTCGSKASGMDTHQMRFLSQAVTCPSCSSLANLLYALCMPIPEDFLTCQTSSFDKDPLLVVTLGHSVMVKVYKKLQSLKASIISLIDPACLWRYIVRALWPWLALLWKQRMSLTHSVNPRVYFQIKNILMSPPSSQQLRLPNQILQRANTCDNVTLPLSIAQCKGNIPRRIWAYPTALADTSSCYTEGSYSQPNVQHGNFCLSSQSAKNSINKSCLLDCVDMVGNGLSHLPPKKQSVKATTAAVPSYPPKTDNLMSSMTNKCY